MIIGGNSSPSSNLTRINMKENVAGGNQLDPNQVSNQYNLSIHTHNPNQLAVTSLEINLVLCSLQIFIQRNILHRLFYQY